MGFNLELHSSGVLPVARSVPPPFLGTIDTISEIMIFSKVVQILIFYHFAEDHNFWNGVYSPWKVGI